MTEFNAFVSPQYPVLHSVARLSSDAPVGSGAQLAISLGLLVKGIPSFLASIPVSESDLDPVTDSLRAGDVRLAAVGVSVSEGEIGEAEVPPPEPWQPDREETGRFPAAFLSLVCADGRRIGVARIVAREGSATPEEVAKFVLSQIAKGVQIADLASTP